MASTKKKKKKKKFRFLVYFLFFLSLITLGVLFVLDIIPLNYFILLAVMVIALDFIISYFLLGKGWLKRLFGTILTLCTTGIMGFILFYSFNTLDFLHKISGGNYNTENYNMIVFKSSNYKKLKDLEEEDIGYFKTPDDEGMEQAKNYVDKKEKVNFVSYDDMSKLLDDFLNEEVEAILVEDAEKNILEEESDAFLSLENIIYSFSIDISLEDDLTKDVNITNQPFNVFISGIDTYGKITSVSRSDVNMVITVNPNTNQVLLTSIPRDYYVKLNGINTTYKDKLTHAGIHGIETSVKTVEDLLDIDINYYAKVNFTSLVAIVDKLGGIDVETDEAFKAYYVEDEVVNYSFKKGTNHLNGKQALAYCRERKSLTEGDIARTKHQQQVLEAILNKALSKSIITKYNDLLNSLEGKVITNMGTKNMTSLIKKQLKNMSSWDIMKNTLTGTSDYDYTYSYKNSKSYVMVPLEESLNTAKEKINQVMNAKK